MEIFFMVLEVRTAYEAFFFASQLPMTAHDEEYSMRNQDQNMKAIKELPSKIKINLKNGIAKGFKEY